jgi:hypothetical protein
MIDRGPGSFAVIFTLTSPHLHLLTGEGRSHQSPSYDSEKAWSSTNHSTLSGLGPSPYSYAFSCTRYIAVLLSSTTLRQKSCKHHLSYSYLISENIRNN